MLPRLPGWDGLHPLVIHFPIALLMVAPIFVVLAIVVRRHATAFSLAALVLLLLGTAATFVAVATGKAAGELAEHNDAINAVIEEHEELGETTRNVFTGITIAYAAFLLLAGRTRLFGRPAARTLGNVVFLVALLGGSVLLVRAGHEGARLVHQLGVHAVMGPAPSAEVERH